MKPLIYVLRLIFTLFMITGVVMLVCRTDFGLTQHFPIWLNTLLAFIFFASLISFAWKTSK